MPNNEEQPMVVDDEHVVTPQEFNDRIRKILEYGATHGDFTREQLREATGLSDQQIAFYEKLRVINAWPGPERVPRSRLTIEALQVYVNLFGVEDARRRSTLALEQAEKNASQALEEARQQARDDAMDASHQSRLSLAFAVLSTALASVTIGLALGYSEPWLVAIFILPVCLLVRCYWLRFQDSRRRKTTT